MVISLYKDILGKPGMQQFHERTVVLLPRKRNIILIDVVNIAYYCAQRSHIVCFSSIEFLSIRCFIYCCRSVFQTKVFEKGNRSVLIFLKMCKKHVEFLIHQDLIIFLYCKYYQKVYNRYFDLVSVFLMNYINKL